jgi:hypothetical protein
MNIATSKSTFDYTDELVTRLTSKPGLRGPVDGACIQCIYDPMQDGTWRKQVANCTSKGCSLYSVRPGTTKEKARTE